MIKFLSSLLNNFLTHKKLIFYVWTICLFFIQVFFILGMSTMKHPASFVLTFCIFFALLEFLILLILFIFKKITFGENDKKEFMVPSFLLTASAFLFLVIYINNDIIINFEFKNLKYIPLTAFNLGKELLIITLFFSSAYCIGKKLLSFLLDDCFNNIENVLISIGLGIGFLGYYVFLISIFNFAYWYFIYPLIITSLAFGYKDITKIFSHFIKGKSKVTLKIKRFPEYAATVIITMLIMLTLICSFANLLSSGWDTFHQYLTFPEIYKENHGLTFFPFHPHWGFPQFGEMTFLAGMLLGGLATPFLINYFMIILGVSGLVSVFNKFGGKFNIWVISILIGMPLLIIFQSGYLKIESVLFFYLVLIFLVLQKIIFNPKSTKIWIIFSIFCGLLASIKYTSIFSIIGLALPLVVFRKKIGIEWKKLILMAAIVFVIFSPWMIKNYIYYQSPLYPLFSGNDRIKELTGADCNHSFKNSCKEDSFIFRNNQKLKTGNQILSNILLNTKSIFLGGYFDIANMGPFFAIFLPLIFWLLIKEKDIYIKILATFSFIFLILGTVLFNGQAWYFLPVIIPCSIIISYLFEKKLITERYPLIKLLIFLWISLDLLFFMSIYNPKSEIAYIRGQKSLSAAVENKKYFNTENMHGWYRMWRYINKKIISQNEQNGIVYGFMDTQGYFIKDSYKNFIPDFFGYAFSCLSKNGDAYVNMKKLGVGYFIFDSETDKLCKKDKNKEKFLICQTQKEFDNFIKEHAELVRKEGSIRLYKLK